MWRVAPESVLPDEGSTGALFLIICWFPWQSVPVGVTWVPPPFYVILVALA